MDLCNGWTLAEKVTSGLAEHFPVSSHIPVAACSGIIEESLSGVSGSLD